MIGNESNVDPSQVDSMKFQALDRRDLRLRLGFYLVFWIIFFVAFFLLPLDELLPYSDEVNSSIIIVGAVLLFFLFGFGLLQIYKVFDNQGYIVEPSNITFRDGWLVLRILSVPFGRVQHVELIQPFLDKSLGLGRIKIYTAGGSSSDLSIRGLDYEKAAYLKNYILKQVVELTDGEE